MDIIKGVYNILTKHLGTEHRGKVQLGSEHDELRKDIEKYVSKVANAYTIRGRDEAEAIIDQYVLEAFNEIHTRQTALRNEMSKQDVSE